MFFKTPMSECVFSDATVFECAVYLHEHSPILEMMFPKLGAIWCQSRQEALGLPRARELVAPLKQGAQRYAEVFEALVWCD